MLERRLYTNGEKPTFFKLKKRKFSASLTKKTENLLKPFPSLQSTKGFPTEKKESLSSISLFFDPFVEGIADQERINPICSRKHHKPYQNIQTPRRLLRLFLLHSLHKTIDCEYAFYEKIRHLDI